MTNEEMKAGRYLRWHRARQALAWMTARWDAGMTVYITTYTRSTKITPARRDAIRATKSGVYMQRGKHWDCIDGTKISAR